MKKKDLLISLRKRFINQFSNNNYHFIDTISNDTNHKKIVPNLS